VLQQVGTPLEVYERPVNVFVANFIGTPPMNFLGATVSQAGATLAAAAFSIPTPAAWRAAAAKADGRRVRIGIRPEKIGLATPGAAGPGIVRAAVEVVELLGNEAVFHGRAGDDILIAKSESHHAPSVGAQVALQLDLEALHLFDAESERRLD
jgi:multiple sugar transport system ATP-binding protein